MIEIKRASELGESCRPRLGEVFVDGFGNELTYFAQNSQKLARALEHMFVLDAFFVALVGGEISGIAACTGGKAQAIDSALRELVNHLGFIRGTIASIVFRQYFQKPAEKTGDGIASVGFVATAPGYRGRGVATALLKHIHTVLPYNEFVLEAASNNLSAIKLYEKLGYREFKREKQRYPKLSGFDYMVHMQYMRKYEG